MIELEITMSMIEKIPDDPVLLREYARRLQAELRSQMERAELYKREYEKLAREAFGRRSERVDGQDEGQLVLFDRPDPETAPASANTDKPTRERKKRRGGGGRSKLPPHLARIEVTSSDDGPTTCDCCGGHLVGIGEDRSERLERIPAQHKVLVVIRKKRACPKCPSAGVVTQPAPPFALARSKYADGFVAQVLVDKYADNIPLRRQVTRLKREQIDVPIANLCRVVTGSADLLKHVVGVMADELRRGPFLQGDGTGLPILDGPNNDRVSGALWVYTDGDQAVFEATKTHEGRHAAAFLEGFQGVFLPDGASTYNEATRAESIVRAGCWAHARRKFFEARHHHVHAFTALRKIRDLFLLEREVWQLDAEGRQRMRQERAVPWLRDFRDFIDAHLSDAEPRSAWHGALKYADNQWDRLTAFVDHSDVPIHNNASELALRGPVTGRKNWLFAGSEGGADAAAVHFSIMHSCMLAGVDPYAYLRDVLHRLPDATPTALRQLTPKAWAERARDDN
jgi:transposase